jgi:hypothetical protein
MHALDRERVERFSHQVPLRKASSRDQRGTPGAKHGFAVQRASL